MLRNLLFRLVGIAACIAAVACTGDGTPYPRWLVCENLNPLSMAYDEPSYVLVDVRVFDLESVDQYGCPFIVIDSHENSPRIRQLLLEVEQRRRENGWGISLNPLEPQQGGLRLGPPVRK